MATVKFFGWAKDLAGTAESTMDLPAEISTDGMWDVLIARYPSLASHRKSFMLAVNREYAAAGAVVRDDDEVAVIPPVSGG